MARTVVQAGGRDRAAVAQVELDKDRIVPLANFRGSVRPVLLAGSQGYLNRALKASELFRTELRARGISVIPIALTSQDPGEKLAALKREFRYARLCVSSPCSQCLQHQYSSHERLPLYHLHGMRCSSDA